MDDLGLYDEEQGMYFDRLHLGDGTEVMLKVHSIGGIIPLLASVVLDQAVLDQAEQLGKGFASYYRRVRSRGPAQSGRAPWRAG